MLHKASKFAEGGQCFDLYFRYVLMNAGEPLNENEAELMMKEADKDGDGTIDYEGKVSPHKAFFANTGTQRHFFLILCSHQLCSFLTSSEALPTGHPLGRIRWMYFILTSVKHLCVI